MSYQINGQTFSSHETYCPRWHSQTNPTSEFYNPVTGSNYQSLPAYSEQAASFHNQQPLDSRTGYSHHGHSWTTQQTPFQNSVQTRYTVPVSQHRDSSHFGSPSHELYNFQQRSPREKASAYGSSEIPSRSSQFIDVERVDDQHFEKVIETMLSTQVSTVEYKALVRATMVEGKRIGLTAAMIQNMIIQAPNGNGIVIQAPSKLLQIPQKRNQLQHIYHTLCTLKRMPFSQRPNSPSKATPTPQPSGTPARTQSQINFEQTRRNEHAQSCIDKLAKYTLSENHYRQMREIILSNREGIDDQEMESHLDTLFKFNQRAISMTDPNNGFAQRFLHKYIIPTLDMIL